MCDATTLISSKQTDLHSCWIIYTKSDGKERLTVTDAKPMIPNAHMADNDSIANSPIDDNDLDEDDDDDENDGPDQSFHEMLDPELQPEQPIPNNAESEQIYREHRRLAKEYLRVDTKLYYAQDFKEKLLVQMDPAERQQKQELLKKMSEKEELRELYNNLKQQLEKIHAGKADCSVPAPPMTHRQLSQDGSISGEMVADDGWVVIGSNQNA